MIQQEAEGKAQAARIRAIAEAEADAIRKKAESLMQAGQAYLDLRRLELAPSLTHEVAAALARGQFVNFGTGGPNGQSAAASGSDDVMRVVQTLMAAQIITGNGLNNGNGARQNGSDSPDITALEPEAALIRPQTATPVQTPQQKSPFRKS